MGLQRQAPLGMLLDIFHAGLRNSLIALRVARVAGLQVIIIRFELKVRHMFGIRKDHLHLATTLVNGLLLG